MLYWLYRRVLAVLETQQVSDIDNFLMSALLGWRDNKMALKAYNVLTAIDYVDKEYNGFREMYDSLSEFAHPNWCGAHGAYAKIDRESRCVDLGPGMKGPKSTGIPQFCNSLVIFKTYYSRLADMLPDFVRACDVDIGRRST